MPKTSDISFVNVGTFEFPLKPGEKPPGSKEGEKVTTFKKHEKRLLKKYKEAVKGGSSSAINSTQWQYVKARSTWFINTFEANSDLPIEKQYSFDECSEIAKLLSLKTPKPTEPIPVHFIKKSSGGKRLIFNFGVRYRTHQKIAKKLLSPRLNLKIWQYDLKGQLTAIKQIKNTMEQGFHYWVRLDIKDFFPSVDGELMPEMLPLPKAMTNSAVISRFMNDQISFGSSTHDDRSFTLARRGIPQGASCSPSVAAYVLSQLKIVLPNSARIFSYVDDFLVVGKSEEEAETFADVLKSAVAALPGGHFLLREKTNEFEPEHLYFLGFDFIIDGGSISLNVPHSSWIAIGERMDIEFDACSKIQPNGGMKDIPKHLVEGHLITAWRILAGWENYFSLADNLDDYYGPHLQILKDTCKYHGWDYDDLISSTLTKYGETFAIVFSADS